MNKDQKTGALIIALAITLIVVTLILLQGWCSGSTLYINYSLLWGGSGIFDSYYGAHKIPSRYVIALLVIVAGYGVILFFSLIPPILGRQTGPKGKED